MRTGLSHRLHGFTQTWIDQGSTAPVPQVSILPYLRRAALVMAEDPPAATDRLVDAMAGFRAAMSISHNWPQDFRDRALEIERLMLRDGTVGATAENMDAGLRNDLRGKLRTFADDAEAHCRHEGR
jgi:hypothetical protein